MERTPPSHKPDDEAAEDRKRRLETEKLQLEINDLKRSYWQRVLIGPEAIFQLVTAVITVTGAIFGAYILIHNNYFENQKLVQQAEIDASQSEAARAKLQAALDTLNAKQTEDDAEAKTKAAETAIMQANQDVSTANAARNQAVGQANDAKLQANDAKLLARSINKALEAEEILYKVSDQHPPVRFPLNALDQARSLAKEAWSIAPTDQARAVIALGYSRPTDLEMGYPSPREKTRISHAIFSRDGSHLLTTGNLYDAGVYLWQIADGKVMRDRDNQPSIKKLASPPKYVAADSAVFSPDEKFIVAYLQAGASRAEPKPATMLRIWEKQPGDFEYSDAAIAFPGGPFVRVDPVFSKDDSLAFLNPEHEVQVWSPQNPRLPISMRKCQGTSPPASIEFSPDGKLLAIGTIDQRIHLCDPKTGEESRKEIDPLKGSPGLGDISLNFSRDGTKLLVSSGQSGSFDPTIWDTNKSQPICTIELQRTGDHVLSWNAAFSRDAKSQFVFAVTSSVNSGTMASVWSSDGCKWIKDLEKGGDLDTEPGVLFEVLPSFDGKRFMVTGNLSMGIWDANTLKKLAILKPECDTNGFAFSPDGGLAVAWTPCRIKLGTDYSEILSVFSVVPENDIHNPIR